MTTTPADVTAAMPSGLRGYLQVTDPHLIWTGVTDPTDGRDGLAVLP